MAGVFISYRRDDTGGYAGRLFDDLVRRFGDSAVFRDLADIAPGSDFVNAIERAVGSCDVVLVVIGRSWLTSADAHRRVRLADPQDFLRREVAMALERNIPVVPVLVQDARMPTPEELPEDLRALARRQAIELSDSRWDTDVEALEKTIGRLLGSSSAAASAAAQGRARMRRPRRSAAIAAAAIGLAAFTYWAASRSDDVPEVGSVPAKTDRPQTASSGSDGAPPASTAPPSTAGRAFAIARPAIPKVRVNRQEFEILAVRLEPSGDLALLSFLVRMTDHSGVGDNFWDEWFRLVLPDGRKAASSRLNKTIDAYAAEDGEVRFEIPIDLLRTELEIAKGEEATRIPIDLRDRKAIAPDGSVDRFGLAERPLLVNSVARLPVALEGGAEARFDGVVYTVLALSVDRYNVEKAALTVTLRCTADNGAVNFWDRNIRLLVDGVPRAPDEPVNEIVAKGTSKDARFVFLLGQRPDTLKLTVRVGRTIEIPIDVSQIH